MWLRGVSLSIPHPDRGRNGGTPWLMEPDLGRPSPCRASSSANTRQPCPRLPGPVHSPSSCFVTSPASSHCTSAEERGWGPLPRAQHALPHLRGQQVRVQAQCTRLPGRLVRSPVEATLK